MTIIGKGGSEIVHKFSGLKVSDILKSKKGSIKQAQLPPDSPSWEEFSKMTWEQIEQGVTENIPGFRVVRKLLSDRRFDR
ncbi:MAG TPA: hypothetical protein DEG17_09340 [Cyanobacteria bacterium UBA11149]|nr:hypothetical protein [Cyanobacteria bacterium UBA11367]HBE57487.1 hypothetical protein [Cyanobacteria bacterium UBA11366]HBK66390.1 hypothetical protein [Cyanobacteria bacterium UBA11166]HBR73581.1 hypothetical protein [Cyanobacteria bacterium UBA11159]HBS71146.1 hypothetical protein [Cyanobacteria bacterium UBA11153]HBW89053.1 hypothetical protein [Cyanobacteria bacterium UBA11149]HCA96711.1 hypothetical protein [Cyanobacteria bacterium UBA9226]